MSRQLLYIAVAALMAAAAYAQNGTMQDMMGDQTMQMATAPVANSCVSDPSQANCTNYVYPTSAAAADLASLCKSMPFMSACSVAKACNESGAGPTTPTSAGAANISQTDPNICKPFQLLATFCRPQEGMTRMKGCATYTSLCANGTKVKQCLDMSGVASVPTSETLNNQVRSACEAMPHGDCNLCLPSYRANQTWGNCDLLDVFGSVCAEMPEMRECVYFQKICAKDRTLWVCKKYPTAIVDTVSAASGATDRPGAAAVTSNTGNSTAAGGSQSAIAKSTNAAAAAGINVVLLLLSAVLLVAML